jgi:predicted TIM-barrel fold metal-dependent hydrolase
MTKIIDADAHIVEPRALWQAYVDPAFRDRIPQIAKDNQCFLSREPDDVTFKTAVTLGTENVLMWASDYPHFDCTFPGVVDELREGCAVLPEGTQRKIMGENAARCYGLA